jgi:hypothetical protein
MSRHLERRVHMRPNPARQAPRTTRRAIKHLAVAVIAVVPIGACSSDASDDSSGAAGTDEPADATAAPTPTPAAATSTTPPATAEPNTATGAFLGAEEITVTFTVPDGWSLPPDRPIVALGNETDDQLFGVLFTTVSNIYEDPRRSTPADPPVGPTVDDLASAWADVRGIEATAVSDITVDGFHGKQIDITVPDYTDDGCSGGKFRLWQEPPANHAIWAQGPHQHNQLWILDVDGTRVMISASYFPNTSTQHRSDLTEILDSIQIG